MLLLLLLLPLPAAVPLALAIMLHPCSPMSVFATKSMPGSAWMRLVFC
jgi:hypothetical protein